VNIDLNFTEEDWERVEHDWIAWWAGEIQRPMVILQTADMFFNASKEEYTREFLLEKPVNEVIDYYQARLKSTRFYGDAWPKWWPNFGPGIVAGFLGAKVQGMPEQHTVWFEADKPVPIEDLHFVYNDENIWWQRVMNITRTAVERWGSKIAVGHTDLGGMLDILSSFRTTNQLLLDLYDAPDEVIRLTGEIRTAWLRYYDELYDIIKQAGRGTTRTSLWSPGRLYLHQCDFSYMISPKMFERFVLPDLKACFEYLDHAFYHLDGKGQIPHLDMLLSMENLRGIQWVPGAGQPDASKWLSLLKRIRDAGKLCQVFVSPEGARNIVRELGGRGFAFFVMSLEPMSHDESEDFLKVLASEDIGSK